MFSYQISDSPRNRMEYKMKAVAITLIDPSLRTTMSEMYRNGTPTAQPIKTVVPLKE